MRTVRKYWHVVLSFAFALAAVIYNPPTGEMVVSWDWGAVFLLAALMIVVEGMKEQGLFDALSRNAPYFRKTWALLLFLSLSALVMGMFLTALVAVTVIAPVAVKVLKDKERETLAPKALAIIALSSLSGSMLLPSGSPANLLISFHTEDFLFLMWPFALLGATFSLLSIVIMLGRRLDDTLYMPAVEAVLIKGNKGLKMLYVCLALTVSLATFRLVFWLNCFALVVAVALLFDRSILRGADYSMPLTLLLLSIAGTSFGLEGGFAAPAIVTELLGSTLSAPLFVYRADNVSTLLKTVNICSLPLFSSLPALAALRFSEDRKAFARCYLALSLPLFLLMAILAHFL